MNEQMKNKMNHEQTYRNAGYWGDATLLNCWNNSVLASPDKEAVVDTHGARFSYKALDLAADKVAAYFVAKGIAPRDCISFQIPGWVEFTMVYIACLKIDAIANPLLPDCRTSDLLYQLSKCESKVFLLPDLFKKYKHTEMLPSLIANVPTLQEIVVIDKFNTYEGTHLTLGEILQTYVPCPINAQASSNDVAAILFTSGTERMPKGVMLTHNNIIFSQKTVNAIFNISYLDTMLMSAPVAHVTGFFRGVNSPLIAGAKSVLQDVFTSDVMMKTLVEEKCTCTMGAPVFVRDALSQMKKSHYDLSHLRYFFCGGAPIPSILVKEALSYGFRIISVYGSTECAPQTAIRADDAIDKITNTDGRALPGIELKVVDKDGNTLPVGLEGECIVRGPQVFLGYLREPELTAQVLIDGWLYSGDLCVMDADGYIRITGRKKDIIVRGGENISATELEEILLQHPKVFEAAVVAMTDTRMGEKACAYVTLSNSEKTFTFEEMIELFTSSKVAKFKYPERLEIINSMPRTASGKIQKYILRQDISRKVESQ